MTDSDIYDVVLSSDYIVFNDFYREMIVEHWWFSFKGNGIDGCPFIANYFIITAGEKRSKCLCITDPCNTR